MRLIDVEDIGSMETRTDQKLIDTAPTVDAVPVVRCKDCKWGSFHTHVPPWTHWCVRDPKEAPSKQAMDFCSYGERKDDETD